MRKTFKYRLFTTRLESELLGVQLGEACRLYNAALEERRDAWKQRVSINYYDQANQLKEIRAAGDLGLANFSCCQDILRRVSKTFGAKLALVADIRAGGGELAVGADRKHHNITLSFDV
jgi:putative transposase